LAFNALVRAALRALVAGLGGKLAESQDLGFEIVVLFSRANGDAGGGREPGREQSGNGAPGGMA